MLIIYHVKAFFSIYVEIISFLELSKFLLKYFIFYIFSSKHRLHLPCELFVEGDLYIIFQFITGVSSSSIGFE